MQWLAESKQLGEFFSELRNVIEVTCFSKVILKSLDGDGLLKTKDEVLGR